MHMYSGPMIYSRDWRVDHASWQYTLPGSDMSFGTLWRQ